MIPVRILLAGLFISAASPAAAQTDSATESHIQRIIANMLPPVLVHGKPAPKKSMAEQMAELHVPGVSIAYIHDGNIAWARGFGVAKLDGPAVTPDTLFQAGSISKPVAAAAVLHLVQAGKLNLDADVNTRLKSWKVPDNDFTAHNKVTLRELLTHTAGMTVHGFEGYADGAPVPTLVQVLDGVAPANSPAIRVDTVPGTLMRYSGGGYVVMQQMLDDVTGQPFDKLLHDTVLAPIGMSHSTYAQPLPPDRRAAAATPYDDKGTPIAGGPHTYPEMAPAGLWTTPSDLALFIIEIQKSLSGKSNRVLSKPMTEEMLRQSSLGNWGLGLEVGGTPAHRYFRHNGADAGFQSDFVAFDNGDGVAVMTNSDHGLELIDGLERSVAAEYGWPDLQPPERTEIALDMAAKQALVGKYQRVPGAVMTITLKNGQLYAQLRGPAKFELYPESRTRFFLTIVDAELSFEMGPDGRGVSVTNHQGGQDSVFNRVAD